MCLSCLVVHRSAQTALLNARLKKRRHSSELINEVLYVLKLLLQFTSFHLFKCSRVGRLRGVSPADLHQFR